jgi:arginase family enzyme
MVWIDAHGDCVSQPASQTGKPFPSMDPHDVVMVCLRADDPLEQAVIDQSGIEIVSISKEIAVSCVPRAIRPRRGCREHSVCGE